MFSTSCSLNTFGAALLLCLFIAGFASAVAPAFQRETLNFNRDWKFQLGNVSGTETPDFQDAQWQTAGSPHSFSLPYLGASKFYVGNGWHRKHFQVPASWTARWVNLEFDGVFQIAEVFINGRKARDHQG